MSSILDLCAEMERDAADAVMRTDEMSIEDGCLAAEWITQKMRKNTGNNSLKFPVDWIPQTGMVVCNGKHKVFAVAMLYIEKSSPVAVCGWCVSNPENKFWESRKAVKLLLSVMPIYAKKCGAKYLLTTFGNRGINRILDDIGFVDGEISENKFMIL